MPVENSIVASIEGNVGYTDGTEAGFAAALDKGGNILTDGVSTAFGDAITRVRALFTALGGSLTCSPTGSGKTANDMTLRFEGDATIGDGTKIGFSAEYTLKTGTVISLGAAADYATAVTNFKTTLQNMIAEIAGVSATIT